VISDESIPARGKHPKLAGGAKHKLAAAAKRAMSKVGPAPSTSASETTRTAAPVTQTAPTRPQHVAAQPASRPEEEEEEEEEEAQGDEANGEEQADGPAAEQPKSGSNAETPLDFVISAGGGMGAREVLVPGRGGGRGISTGLAPALDIGLALEVELSSHWLLRVGGNYRTIFGLSVSEPLASGAVQQNTLSTHSVVVGASMGYLTEGRKSLSLHLFLGWGYRSLSSASDSGLPNTSISGPAIRPELHIAIAKGLATLRIAPELIVVVSHTATLPINVAGLDSVGLAFGGEASLDFRLGSVVGLGLLFRESRASTASGWGFAATENERYILGRLTLTL
jgi:hypothetical protein